MNVDNTPGCFTSPVKEPYPHGFLREKERNGIFASYPLHHFLSRGLQQQLLRNQNFREFNYFRKESHKRKHDWTEFSSEGIVTLSARRHTLGIFHKTKSCQPWRLSQNAPARSEDFKPVPAQLRKRSYSLINKQGKEEGREGKFFSKNTCTQKIN